MADNEICDMINDLFARVLVVNWHIRLCLSPSGCRLLYWPPHSEAIHTHAIPATYADVPAAMKAHLPRYEYTLVVAAAKEYAEIKLHN